MDVLRYSAIQAETTINTTINQRTACVNTKAAEFASVNTAATALAEQVCWVQCREPCLLRAPDSTSQWAFIPGLPGATEGFKVCNTASQFNCGFCCAWTVPAGITRARFQIWGAGGGGGVGRCCGGSPFGSSGAYASVIIPVTAGSTYTLCSGCAFCCRACANNYNAPESRVPGCPSCVAGPGLTNFCANGGQARLGTWMAAYGKRNVNRFANLTQDSAGSCLCCMGNHYCFSNSCATCGEIPYVPGADYFGQATAEGSLVYGVRGMWPRICYDTNHHGYQCHAPIVGSTTAQCILTWTSTCCAGGFRAENGILQVPGAGAYASTAMAGCTCGNCGDIGRMGMVCVTFC